MEKRISSLMRGLFSFEFEFGANDTLIRGLGLVGDISAAVPLIEILPYIQSNEALDAMSEALPRLTGETIPILDWQAWYRWLGQHPEAQAVSGYAEWKAETYRAVDPEFKKFFYEGVDARIPLPLLQWGGVQADGIPSLQNPSVIPGVEADFLEPDDPIFGAIVNGEARAYPWRVMARHEMANDVINGQPVLLSFCTLCGSAILFNAEVGGVVRNFGTSGFLFQSNKLMFDRGTNTLWRQLTGEPVVGELASSSLRLELLPLVLTTWEEWLAQNPKTSVLSLDTGFSFQYLHPDDENAAYFDYFNSPDVLFPAFLTDGRRAEKDRGFAVRFFGASSAYPIDILQEEPVVNDTVGPQNLVVVTDPDSSAVRAYARGDHSFRLGDAARELVDENGLTWRVDENSLLPAGNAEPSLERLPGNEAFWFGWFAANPQTKLYAGARM
ncbi:MAG: DUF3179 domain-containing protein [Chloroflexi bacterium]|nr:DUF3179 domain-containing protein [Chloroflexota bacterium]